MSHHIYLLLCWTGDRNKNVTNFHFFSLFFLSWAAHAVQRPLAVHFLKWHPFSILPLLLGSSYFPCWAAQDTAQIAAKFSGNLFFSEIEQVNRKKNSLSVQLLRRWKPVPSFTGIFFTGTSTLYNWVSEQPLLSFWGSAKPQMFSRCPVGTPEIH